MEQKNSEYGRFSCSVQLETFILIIDLPTGDLSIFKEETIADRNLRSGITAKFLHFANINFRL